MEVRIVNVNKWYGEVHALKDINITIDTGKFTTLLGPSGCGKTTLLRCIAGLEIPDSGEIYFDDRLVYSSKDNINVSPKDRYLGMVFQAFALWPHMTVFENVAFSLKARKKKQNIKKEVERALEVVRLSDMEERYPNQMSGGQQQRVAFARAIVGNPSIVLFDEPLSALDAVLRDEMRSELVQMVKTMNLTAVYVTHDQIEAMSMSDSIIVMNHGEVIQIGSPETIYQKPADTYVMGFVGKMNWFADRLSGIRPESITLYEPQMQGADVHTEEAVVKNVAYLGEKYEVYLTTDHGDWMIYHNERLIIGDTIKCFYDKKKIVYSGNYEQATVQ